MKSESEKTNRNRNREKRVRENKRENKPNPKVVVVDGKDEIFPFYFFNSSRFFYWKIKPDWPNAQNKM